jgi:hypothetical protein
MVSELKRRADNALLVTHYIAQTERITEGTYGAYNRALYEELRRGELYSPALKGRMAELSSQERLAKRVARMRCNQVPPTWMGWREEFAREGKRVLIST